jgi:hypothetical protein
VGEWPKPKRSREMTRWVSFRRGTTRSKVAEEEAKPWRRMTG